MGKSTTANMFANLGCPVFDADKEVHALYQRGGRAAKEITANFPEVIVKGSVDRRLLSALISKDKTVLPRVEKIVHPMIRSLEDQFINGHKKAGTQIVVLDIPLLFEAERTNDVDVIVVVSANEKLQRERAMQRPGMTAEKLDMILGRQMSDKEKRSRADYVIYTDKSLEDTFEQVKNLVGKLKLVENQKVT